MNAWINSCNNNEIASFNFITLKVVVVKIEMEMNRRSSTKFTLKLVTNNLKPTPKSVTDDLTVCHILTKTSTHFDY